MYYKSVTVYDDNGREKVELNTRGLVFAIPDPNSSAGVKKALLTLERGTDANTVKLVAYPDMYGAGITLIDNIGV